MNKLEEMRKELEEISDWPWIKSVQYSMHFVLNQNNEIVFRKDFAHLDQEFTAKAPERLSLLLDIVERAKEMADTYGGYLKKDIEFPGSNNAAQEFLDYVEEKLK